MSPANLFIATNSLESLKIWLLAILFPSLHQMDILSLKHLWREVSDYLDICIYHPLAHSFFFRPQFQLLFFCLLVSKMILSILSRPPGQSLTSHNFENPGLKKIILLLIYAPFYYLSFHYLFVFILTL